MNDLVWLISVLITGIAAVLIHVYVWKRYHYICPKCRMSFKPGLTQSIFSVNAVELRRLRCPYCQTVDYMEALKDEKNK